MICRNRQPGLVYRIPTLRRRCVFLKLVLVHREKVLRVVPPRTEMVLVKDHEIPVYFVHPLVLLFDGAILKSEEVLKRTEAHDRPFLVGILILFVYRVTADHFGTAQKLPALKVDVCHQVFPPCRANRRLERKHEHSLRFHLLRELVGGKRLAESHLRVPKELWCLLRPFPFR